MAGRKHSQEQKDEFLRVLDRGGTVRAAGVGEVDQDRSVIMASAQGEVVDTDDAGCDRVRVR
jgi:hypothetical protein